MLSNICGAIALILMFLIPGAVEGEMYITAILMIIGLAVFAHISIKTDRSAKRKKIAHRRKDMSMEYQQIKDYLDRLIRVWNEAKSSEDLNSSIQAIMVSCQKIHIYKGIEIISDVIGLHLDSRERDDGKTEFFFVYEGIEFFQIGPSNEEKS